MFNWFNIGAKDTISLLSFTKYASLLEFASPQEVLQGYFKLQSCQCRYLNKKELDREQHYQAATTRNPDCFQFPLEENTALKKLPQLAKWCVQTLQCRLLKDECFHNKYPAFSEKGHVKIFHDAEILVHPSASDYIPRHWVHNESITTVKLRLVLGSSSKTTSGVLLNNNANFWA